MARTAHGNRRADESYAAFCANWRTRFKDRFHHAYAERYWAECLAVDRMDRQRLLALRDQRLAALVDHAVLHVPFYRRWAAAAGYEPGDTVRLADLPIVAKREYRTDIEDFQSDAYSVREMTAAKTSGSSGEPFRFRSHATSRDYNYCCLWRALRRHGLRPGQRRVHVWGRSWSFASSRLRRGRMRLKLAVRDWLNNTLTIDAYALTDRNVAEAVTRIEAFRPVYLHGYVSALYTIARHLDATGRRLDGLVAVITDSEKLYDFQRQEMVKAFSCPVHEHYGSVELGSIAEVDPDGHMRINEDFVIVEQLPTGEAVITNLLATAFPFIRYKLGDLIELDETVPPGLPYATFRRIVGRTVDLVPVLAGGFVHGVALAHAIDPHLAHVERYQIRQVALDRFVVQLVVRGMLPDQAAQTMVADLRSLVGQSADVQVEVVDAIEPAKSGKFRWVISDVSDVALQTLAEME